jgi:hypothetical protein
MHTIEHIMPQQLDDPWKNYLGPEANDEHLPALVHTIGNLCLLSGPANSSAGQNPFVEKKLAYSPVTALARMLKEHEQPWNLVAIQKRSKELTTVAVAIWAWGSADVGANSKPY